MLVEQQHSSMALITDCSTRFLSMFLVFQVSHPEISQSNKITIFTELYNVKTKHSKEKKIWHSSRKARIHSNQT